MDEDISVADVLERAADLIAKPGAWAQGEYGRGPGGIVWEQDAPEPEGLNCFCLYGAVAHVSKARAGCDTPAVKFLEALNVSATGWNDAPERTQDEVVALLRKSAALARERSNG